MIYIFIPHQTTSLNHQIIHFFPWTDSPPPWPSTGGAGPRHPGSPAVWWRWYSGQTHAPDCDVDVGGLFACLPHHPCGMWILECMCFSQGLGSYPSVTCPTSSTWWRATLCTATGTETWYWVETLWTQILRGFWILQVWEYGRNNIRIPTLVETWENRKRR